MNGTPADGSGTEVDRALRRLRRVTTSGRNLPQVDGIRWPGERKRRMRGAPIPGAAAQLAGEEPSSAPVRV
jgi:hypothetical protein